MKQMYGVLLPFVRHRADLNYLLDNMGAEIAIGHSYVRGGDMPEVPSSPGGLLGADFVIEVGPLQSRPDLRQRELERRFARASRLAGRRCVGRRVHPRGQRRRAQGAGQHLPPARRDREPSDRSDGERQAGDGGREAGDGRAGGQRTGASYARVGRAQPPPGRQAVGRPARLRATCPTPGRAGTRASTGTTSRSRTRRAPSSTSASTAAARRPTTSSTCSSADFDGYFNNVAGDRYPFTSPAAGIWGPKVMIVNEMAGSGGDLMPYMFKLRKIGPLVGTRTWGGLVHTADTPPFVDGGSMIAPRGGFFTREGKWAVENEGTRARHRRRELAEGRDCREGSATRARGGGGAAAAQGEPCEPPHQGTGAADVGQTQVVDSRWSGKSMVRVGSQSR